MLFAILPRRQALPGFERASETGWIVEAKRGSDVTNRTVGAQQVLDGMVLLQFADHSRQCSSGRPRLARQGLRTDTDPCCNGGQAKLGFLQVRGDHMPQRFQKLLRPAAIQVLVEAFLAAQLGNTGFTAQAFQDDTDLLFGGIVAPGSPANISNGLFGEFCSGR